MNDDNEIAVAQNEIVIELMDGSIDFEPTRTTARTVGELRTSEGRNMTGKISVGAIIASDSTPIKEGDEVVHQTVAKKGGDK